MKAPNRASAPEVPSTPDVDAMEESTMPCCAACNPCRDSPVYQAAMRWTLLFLTVLSWIFSIVTLASCSFIVIGAKGFGLFSTEDDFGLDGCISWQDFDIDYESSHTTARAFGVIACLNLSFALIGNCLVIFLLKDKFARIVWLVTRIQYPIALVGTLLTFSFWAEFDVCKGNGVCESGAAGTVAAINVFILIGMISVSWGCWGIPIPDEPLCCSSEGCCDACGTNGVQADAHTKPAHAKSVVRTIEITPEGRQVTEEVTNVDGSKTITKTIEQTLEKEEEETGVTEDV